MRYRTRAVSVKTIRPPVKTPPATMIPFGNDRPEVAFIRREDGREAHEGGDAVEDRLRRYRQCPITHANHEYALANAGSVRAAIKTIKEDLLKG